MSVLFSSMTSPSFESPADIYTPLEEIVSELSRRKKDKALATKVRDFLGALPDFIKDEDAQFAFLSRPVMTPNIELGYFLDIIPLFNLSPLLLEYPSKFVSKNQDKRLLAKLCFSKNLGRRNGQIEYKKIIDFSSWEGKDLTEVKTVWGGKLYDFHKDLLKKTHPHLAGVTVDFSDWFDEARSRNEFYYLTFLTLFIRNGVLFENYLNDDKEEMVFFKEKVLPSFKRAFEIFGVKPLIFPLLPITEEKSHVWLSYPMSMKEELYKKNGT